LYGGDEEFAVKGYIDAIYTDLDDSKSQLGYVIILNGCSCKLKEFQAKLSCGIYNKGGVYGFFRSGDGRDLAEEVHFETWCGSKCSSHSLLAIKALSSIIIKGN
jgi:hypothetical protein